MAKQVLDISQMLHLKELGIDTSKAGAVRTDIWVTSDLDEFQKAEDVLVFTESESDYFEFDNPIYTFTLQDVLDLLPTEIYTEENELATLKIHFPNDGYWEFSYMGLHKCMEFFLEENVIDAAYEMLCWCIENGYVKTNKED